MPGEVQIQFRDYSDESSHTSFETDDITAANIDTVETLAASLITAIQGVVAGSVRSRRTVLDTTIVDAGLPATAVAQREVRWRLELADSVTGERIYRELATANLADIDLFAANSDDANMSDAAWVSLKSAIDGNYNNPKTGNSILLIGATLVGRNS